MGTGLSESYTWKEDVKTKGFIKVIKTPEGEAPEWVRRAWVGLELPYIEKKDGNLDEVGILSRKAGVGKRDTFLVSEDKAIFILEQSGQRGKKAAEWWKEKGFSREDMAFVFAADEMEIVNQ